MPSQKIGNRIPLGPPAPGSRTLRTNLNRLKSTREEIKKQPSIVNDVDSGLTYLKKTALIIIGKEQTVDSIATTLFHITQLPNITAPIHNAIWALAYILLHTKKTARHRLHQGGLTQH